MTDINNKIGSESISHVSNMNFEGNRTEQVTAQDYSDRQIENLDNNHAALVGRSMVKKMKKTSEPKFDPQLVANIKSDLATFKGNERIVALSDKIFEKALEKGYSYEDAAKIQQEAVEYFKA